MLASLVICGSIGLPRVARLKSAASHRTKDWTSLSIFGWRLVRKFSTGFPAVRFRHDVRSDGPLSQQAGAFRAYSASCVAMPRWTRVQRLWQLEAT